MTIARTEAPDFWCSSGYHLLAPTPDGRLAVTDDYLRAYLLRPEVAPVPESCAAERALHAELMDDPRRPVAPERLARIADPDAREAYRHVLALRDLLLRHGTLEAAYLAVFRADRVTLPPLMLKQMAHAVLRHLLDGVGDPFRARAAELLFRSQRVTRQGGGIPLADEETLEMYRTSGGFDSLGRLLVEAQTPPRAVELDMLRAENADAYWARSDRFDMVLDIAFTRPGLDALCRVLEAWVAHFLGVRVAIHPVERIRDDRWVWHVGLDAEATRLLNDLYTGQEVGEERLARLLALFRLEFADPADMLARVAGRPVYLALCATTQDVVRLKPQNLLVNLPLARAV